MEGCEGADNYILAEKCKRDVFGRFLFPYHATSKAGTFGTDLRSTTSSAQVSRQRRAYLEDLISPLRSAPRDTKEATSLAMGAMFTVTEPTTPVTCEATKQPRLPAHTLRDPPEASDQRQVTAAFSDLRTAVERPCAILERPSVPARPSSQSGPERHKR